MTLPEEQKIFLHVSYLNPEALKTNEYSYVYFQDKPLFFFFLFNA